MPKKIQNFARSALVKPITVNVGRAGAASLDVIQEVEFVKQEAKIVYILECLQKTSPPVCYSGITIVLFNFKHYVILELKNLFFGVTFPNLPRKRQQPYCFVRGFLIFSLKF